MRKLVAPALLVAAALIAGVAVSAQDQARTQPGHDHKDSHVAHLVACAKECGECALACDVCTAHCVGMLAEGKKDHLRSLQLTQDCSAICSAAACVSAKGGPMADLICAACADACKRCGDECAKYDSPVMKNCANACRECEKACRDMLKHAGANR